MLYHHCGPLALCSIYSNLHLLSSTLGLLSKAQLNSAELSLLQGAVRFHYEALESVISLPACNQKLISTLFDKIENIHGAYF